MNNRRVSSKDLDRCIICGAAGKMRYIGLHDRCFNVPGEWGFMECSNACCGLLWLYPPSDQDELSRNYVDYFTHKIGSKHPVRARLIIKIINEIFKRSVGIISSADHR